MTKYQIHYSILFVRSSVSRNINSKHKSLLMPSAILDCIPKGHIQFRDDHYFPFHGFFVSIVENATCVSAERPNFFLPTAIILQSVGHDVSGFGQRVLPLSSIRIYRPCFKNKVIYRREKKTGWSSVIAACACVCGRGSTFVTLSEYGIFYGTMARKPYVGHWIQCPACSDRCAGSTIGANGSRKMNR